MAQRGLIINGLRTSGAESAKRIIMTPFDKANAAVPGLGYDLDGSRLKDQGSPYIGRARGADALLAAYGTGWSIVSPSLINGKTALRLNGGVGHRMVLSKGLTTKSFTILMVATIGPEIRDSAPANTIELFSIYSGATAIVRARFAVTTGNLSFSTTASLGAATVAKASLPASNTPAIFAFCRDDADGTMTISINGVTLATGTDPMSPDVSEDKVINLGGVDAISANRSYYGDILHFIPMEGHLIRKYPALFNRIITTGKAEFGIA
ncbi:MULTISPECIES: hypothetical protein [unclassified Rhizobium]|uniref:hypothetical protein n=2 Tax=Rhizobium TaxID=379 RepID=UPI0007143C9C|nr:MULTISPECIES: hypothetical protein [unclassified Rhizobium]KQT03223.1 hypothetical protein ASG42_24760 [Rhizobium sp. Leaf391]KQU08382.1 hypothetical protein ASG68_22600 [Rhizobium sp. Leaf453]